MDKEFAKCIAEHFTEWNTQKAYFKECMPQPSAADLDAVAEEERVRQATSCDSPA